MLLMPYLGPDILNAGIDKLTEKSQVSEDGTMRSLEPESSESPTEGNPPAIVSDTESWSGVRLYATLL